MTAVDMLPGAAITTVPPAGYSRAFGLPAWSPAPVATAAASCAAAAALLSGVADELVRAAAGMDLDWSGAAAVESTATQRMLAVRARSLADVLTRLEHALASAADQVGTVAYLADLAEDTARAHGLVVTTDGRLMDLLGTAPAATPDLTALAAEARRTAEVADEDLCRALRAALLDTHAGPVASPPVGLVAADRALDATGWAALDRQGQLEEVARHPEVVGATDGLPAWARDRANRLLLDRAEVSLTAQVAALAPPDRSITDLLAGPGGTLTVGTLDGGARQLAYQQAVDKLAAVRATRAVLDQRDGETRQLLLFDVSGRQAEVAVSVGDVDTADHLAVVVDGFTTTVQRDLAGADAVAEELAELSRRESMGWGDRGQVAVVTWLGYDTPQAADTLRSTHSVVLRASAEAGAASLARFLGGVDRGQHLTLVGHSYGSTVAGLAVAQGGTGVDDLVVMGSPGLGTSDLSRIALPEARIHVLEARNDPVADLGWFGADPSRLAGIDRLSTEAMPLPSGRTGAASTGHSAYLASGTTSQWNVAAVAAGVPAAARRPVQQP